MLRKANINTKILALVLTIVFVVVVLEIILSYYKKREIINDAYKEELGAIADVQIHNIEREFDVFKHDLMNLQGAKPFVQEVAHLERVIKHGHFDSIPVITRKLQYEFFDPFEANYEFADIVLLDSTGSQIYHYYNQAYDSTGLILSFNKRKMGFYHSLAKKEGNRYYSYASLPLTGSKKEFLGIIVCKIDIDRFVKERIFLAGLHNEGEIVVGVKNHKDVEYIYSSKKLEKNIPNTHRQEDPIFLASSGAQGFGIYRDYEEVKTLGLWKPVEHLGLGMVIKIPVADTDSVIDNIMYLFAIKGILSLGVALALGLLISRRLTKPIRDLKKALDTLSTGDLPEPVNIQGEDEIAEMAEVVNRHAEQLRLTSQFALQIGQGGYEELEYEPLSQNDILGHSLLFMQQSLKDATIKDDERSWVITGVAELSDVMRSQQTMDALCEGVVEYIYHRIHARQAVMYVVDDPDDPKELIQTASFAYGRKKFIDRKVSFQNGILGDVAMERKSVIRTEIPEDHLFITSGLEEMPPPASMFVVPMTTNDKLFGVLEFSADHVFADNQIRFVEEVADKIAQSIFSLKASSHTRQLLEEISHAQTRLRALLENASEVIVIYEDDASIRYVSPSVENILGYKQDELIGTKDMKNIHEKGIPDFEKLFNALLTKPQETHTAQYSYYTKSGQRIWLEATGKNMINDRAINGLVINIRDITERRRAEMEEKKRGQMQALSENSLDLIIRISNGGQIFYSNPMLKQLTGLNPEEVLNKSLNELELDENVIKEWDNVVRQVLLRQDKYGQEMDFPTEEGLKVMQVNAIPEYDDKDRIASVLLVSHDITERKAIENEIKKKNHKIQESINYAERIQTTILPDERLIRKDFPQSFIYFKPRDIVSGDFPYLFERGDDVYMSAVDCTGHGVPGAMISIVAYFLLNEVIELKGLRGCGEILDELDRLVTKTFRQDYEDAKIKDGMDIALVRLNRKEGIIEYAGAHRPLYLLHENELKEIKGDKWPIGGGKAYKNKTDFTVTTEKIIEGDRIYFFSDGYPDQFGGPDNRKYGGKRIKRLLTEEIDAKLPMEFVAQKFDQEFTKWKGQVKQTDDILVFGVKF